MGPLRALALAALLSLPACEEGNAIDVHLYVSAQDSELIRSFLRDLPLRVRLSQTESPEDEMRSRDTSTLEIAFVDDLECGECYRLERERQAITVHSGDRLGLQYGFAHALETTGVRFFSPWKSYIPDTLEVRETGAFGVTIEPERERRGLHLHTIHPTEAYYAFWEPGEDNLYRAQQVLDWIVKNRGNYVQWVALDNIMEESARTPWREHTRAILDAAETRGLQTGIGVQLFGASNLQQGFDLIDFEAGEGDEEEAMRSRWQLLLKDTDFDNILLSFGEFFSEDAQRFIDLVNLSHDVLQEVAPGTELSTLIHVGKELEVEYDGETMIYYFLVQFAKEAITPWVHTVMYYNLFEDAGGAYHHDDFTEHRGFLLDRLAQGLPVAYQPETAYWVAFDNSVPTYMPLYVRNRWLDLDRIRRESTSLGGDDLPQHVLFSTGWEWGYWQNDYTALRTSHTLAQNWRDEFEAMYASFPRGDELAALLIELTEAQAHGLMSHRLTPYLAGRDISIDAGRLADIVSQPDRPALEEVMSYGEEERAAFSSQVLERLLDLQETTARIRDQVAALDLPSPWGAELRDAIAVTASRARFAHALFSAALALGAGEDTAPWLATLDEELAVARQLVDKRHSSFLFPDAKTLTQGNINATLYQWGYLKQTQDLCYWQRERIEIGRLVGDRDEPIPTCLFH